MTPAASWELVSLGAATVVALVTIINAIAAIRRADRAIIESERLARCLRHYQADVNRSVTLPLMRRRVLEIPIDQMTSDEFRAALLEIEEAKHV